MIVLFTNSIQLMVKPRLSNSHCHINNKRWHVDQISDLGTAQTPTLDATLLQ